MQLWYRISQGFILKNKLLWEIWSYTAFRLFFFSGGFFLELFQMPHNRTFGGECFESWQWSLVKTCFIPRNLLNPFQPSTLALAVFFLNYPPWSIKQNEKNLLSMTTPSHLTSWWWDPSKGSASCNALLDQALIKKPQCIKQKSSGFMQHDMAFVRRFRSTWWNLTLGSTLVLTLDPALQPFLSMQL